jgi:hypothetical protein
VFFTAQSLQSPFTGFNRYGEKFGLDHDAWDDEAMYDVIQLSLNEEARSIGDIEQRAKIAQVVVDAINAEQE